MPPKKLSQDKENTKQFKCDSCPKAFSWKHSLTCHWQDNHKAERILYRCHICSRLLKTKQSLRVHTKFVHRDNGDSNFRFQCVFCNKPCHSIRNFEDHIRYHIHERPFSCKTCGKESHTNGVHRRHSKIHEPDRERIFECNLCSKTFFDKSGLIHHIRSHTLEKPYKCLTCGKDFGTKHNLETHRNTVHVGMKPFACPICDRKFSRKGHMSRHVRGLHAN